MTAEQIMKKALDGWFYTYNELTLKTRARAVEKDFIPTHKPHAPILQEGPGRGARPWTPDEDASLFTMYDDGLSFREMADVLGISDSLANNRFRLLCAQQGIYPETRKMNQKYSAETEAHVVHLHVDKRMTFREIAAVTGLTLNQALGLWSRWKRREMEEAA
jgi:hypothetical protein